MQTGLQLLLGLLDILVHLQLAVAAFQGVRDRRVWLILFIPQIGPFIIYILRREVL